MKNKLTYEEALERGLSKVCTKCGEEKSVSEYSKHKGNNYGIQSRCKECVSIYQKSNKDKLSNYYSKYRCKNKDKLSNYYAKYHNDNKEQLNKKHRDYRIDYYSDNKNDINNRNKIRQLGNLEKESMKVAKYRANKLQRTRQDSDYKFIGIFYFVSSKLTEIMGKIYHVDHIIPLQGEFISGFHHQGNLQVMRGSDNQSKSNKY